MTEENRSAGEGHPETGGKETPSPKPARERNVGPEAIKPFRLVKYLSLTSLMVILVCTMFLSGFISQRAKTILVQKSEQYALLIAENLNHQVFYQFTVPTLITEGEIRLSRPNQFERLDRVVRNTIQGFSVEQVNIYDPEQILSYSTDPQRVGMKGDIGDLFERAWREETVSVLSGEGSSFLGFEWRAGARKLTAYLPMWEERSMTQMRGKVLGVFEITLDVTDDYKAIHRFQWIIVLSFLGFVGILFVTILLIAARAEKIIAARAAERLKLEEQLHQTERLAALGEMIAGVSHEIRNPLGIIRTTAELLHGRLENDRQKRLSSIIVEESTRLNDILTEFLDFARPKALRVQSCRLEEVLDRNLEVMEPECQRLGIQVERDYRTGPYGMEADADLLYRAFVNLLANALQAMPQGGRLRLETSFANGRDGSPHIELRIQDSGHGIPAELKKKIFNPFFTTREKGTGLGLAIVRSIIDGHNGDMEVVSEEGKGTTMIVRLPLVQPNREAAGEESR
ncbi:MAG TPA: ATP-binding protein [Syntrophobacteraceae bacterium]|nr:ATP-binding protein [Syntrophobacteraceae bacterium]